MITDLFETSSAKILALFSLSPGSSFTRKEIKEKTLLHNATLDLALKMLLHNNLLKQKQRFYSFNFEHPYLKSIVAMLQQEHKARFKEIPLKIYLLLMDVSAFFSSSPVSRIMLFGSYAKLIYTEKSDVDLAFILNEDSRQLKEKINASIRKWEKKYSKVIETHFFLEKDMEKKDKLIEEIKRNGVRLF